MECDWKDFDGDVKESIPTGAPEPSGQEEILRMFVDTSRSRTGYLTYLNMASVAWKQAKVITYHDGCN